MLNIVLFGPPGAGKGTQSQKIINKFNLVHISTGDILRKAISEKTPMGIEAQKLIDDGNYVTDEMAIAIIKEELDRHKNTNGFIFDGFPRTKYQAETFPKLLSEYGGDVNVMISLEVEEKNLINRLINRAKDSGRPDDRKEEIIQKRIGIYNDRTVLVSDYYKTLGKHQSINGDGEIDVIFEEICETIERFNKI
ncbi:MAG: adenylate kinase [Bacteroidales bacterium]|nr:adenylate kinase [Bacteroidales bacterium]